MTTERLLMRYYLRVRTWAAILFVLATSVSPAAAQLFGPGDPIIAIDLDGGPRTSYPGPEGPGNVADQDSSSKYLNFGKERTGFIITPAAGSSTIQSLRLTTANDAEERDPASYDLFGTNDPIGSTDNSLGNGETWTLISSGALALPSTRLTQGAILDFVNATAYTSYKMIFPTVKNPGAANSMQVADVSLFTGMGGTGTQILMANDPALAVSDVFASESNYPGAESPANAIDGTFNKYLNFGERNSGFIVRRADGNPTIVDRFTITTANDAEERDPTAWSLFGTNDPVTSMDNSVGNQENWSLVDSGAVLLPSGRNTLGPLVTVNNATPYAAYRMVFTDVKNAAAANSMQIAEISLGGTVIPEPGSGICVLVTAACLGLFARKRNT